jgi:hypothetical protein
MTPDAWGLEDLRRHERQVGLAIKAKTGRALNDARERAETRTEKGAGRQS